MAVYLAVLTTALAYLLYARGLRTTPVTTATTLGLAEPAIAAVLGLTVLGERLSVGGFCGLAVLAIALLTLAACELSVAQALRASAEKAGPVENTVPGRQDFDFLRPNPSA